MNSFFIPRFDFFKDLRMSPCKNKQIKNIEIFIVYKGKTMGIDNVLGMVVDDMMVDSMVMDNIIMEVVTHNMVEDNMDGYDLVEYDIVEYDIVEYDMVEYDMDIILMTWLVVTYPEDVF